MVVDIVDNDTGEKFSFGEDQLIFIKRNGYNVSPKDYESFRSEFKKLCKENNLGSKNPNYGKNHSLEKWF